jgi:catechol 2,3-dioxygenase-like lactoylglutathione lyase family enzyme
LKKESEVDIKWFFAGVAVADYSSARAWYERLIGRPADFYPHETEAVWQIIENGWIYVVADNARAGRGLLTLMVDNLDRQIAELRERGLAVGAIETQPGRFRRVVVLDPEGNTITFAQALSPDDDEA